MDEEASKFGLCVSWTKTKIQNLGSGSAPLPVTVDGNTVDPVEEFIYLGSIQSSHSNSGPEYIRRIGLAASAMEKLDCIWSQSKLSISTKLHIYATCVLHVLLYGSVTWTLIQADWKRLDSSHLRCERRILHISWHDFMSNDEVLHRTGLFDVSYIIRKRRLGLFGHVARLRSDVPANSILRICAKTRDGERPSQEWRRTCGRPSTTWVHQICRDTGLSATEALLLAEDKPFWLTIATAGGSG